MQGLAALAHGLFALVYHFMSSLYTSMNSCCEDAFEPVICSSQAAIELVCKLGFSRYIHKRIFWHKHMQP